MKNILIVEDHPILLESYLSLIKNSISESCKINFIKASNCKEAMFAIQSLDFAVIDFALIDINLPPFNEVKTGIDLVFELKRKFFNCKIAIITAFTNPLPIFNLMKKIEVEMIICKSDIDISFFDTITELLNLNETYLSNTIQNELKLFIKKRFDLDEIDLEIIQRLSEGIKTKNIPNYISISLSSIEKRKARMKLLFLENNFNDKNLLEELNNIGLISTVKT